MRRFLLIFLAIVVSGASIESYAADWPTFGHDARRSQTSAEQLDFAKLGSVWAWRSSQPPLPAWGQPAKGDAFSAIRDIGSMRNYDVVFHPIMADGAVVFGSSVDDSVRCLDAATGKLRWSFTAGGPVRIAPAFAAGRIYFGSDDGFAYCLNATDGKLLWRFSPSEAELDAKQTSSMVLNNGRLIPFWPCRTGVLIVAETAYFGCSLLPWKPSLLCAVDAKTGKPEGEGRYVKQLGGVTLEGPLVAGGDLLYAPQGREGPMQFQRADGKHLGTLEEGYGAFCVLTPDNRLLHGPRKKEGGIVDTNATTRTPIATHKDARAMIVSDELSLMLTKTDLIASDLAKRKMRWRVPLSDAAAMILVGNAVVVGRKDHVTAFSAETGEEIWDAPVDGRAYGLIAAGGSLLVSTDTGQLLCFRATDNPIETVKATADAPDANWVEKPVPTPIEPLDDEHLLGRWVFSPQGLQQDSGNQVRNWAKGLPAAISGEVEFQQDQGLDGLALDGARNTILVTDDLSKAQLPTKAMTAEAWVRIDQPLEWGGIVGAIQDNGDDERGWLLGYRQSKFLLAVIGKDASAKLTYLESKTEFELGQWYHVAGTYDGTTMHVYINGKLAASSTEQRGDINYPPQAFYEIGAYHDKDEYHRLTGMLHEVCVFDRALSAEEIAAHHESRPLVRREFADLVAGPRIQFDTSSSVELQWETDQPCPTKIVLTDDHGKSRTIAGKNLTSEHLLRLDDLRRDRRYTFVVEVPHGDLTMTTNEFVIDTYFNYHLAPLPTGASRGDAIDKRYVAAADSLLAQYRKQRGLCFVVGSGDGELAIELARRGKLRVIGLETDAANIASARAKAMSLGLHGSRCSFVQVASLDTLPIPASSANLVVSQAAIDGELPTSLAEIGRVLQPKYGQVIFIREKLESNGDVWADVASQMEGTTQLEDTMLRRDKTTDSDKLTVFAATRESLPDAGDWTQMYGNGSNAAYAGEALGGVTSTDGLRVAWLGRPGPRYQTDRQPRKSSPLFAGGRLYLQGEERIIALDGHNGLVLWSMELPQLARFNLLRDASNWCCDDQHLYFAWGDRCWQVDGETGKVVQQHKLPATDKEIAREWGYIGRTGDWVIGSSIRPNSTFTKFWGKDYWFEQLNGVYTHQVCSETLFAWDKRGQQPQWRYDGGLIWNATITTSMDSVGRTRKSALRRPKPSIYFVESRGVTLGDDDSSRMPQDVIMKETWLVGLDLATGKKTWEQRITISPKTCLANMAYADETLVLVTSYDKRSPVQAFSASDGRPLWNTAVPWPREDHSGHLSRPAIVEGKLFVRPAKLDLKTGELLSNNMPGGGCGTYICSRDAMFFRAGSGKQLSAWEPATGRYTQWPRLRPDCWLSTIAAGGMLLSPEGGGGCSCGHWMEMSVGFVPREAN